MIMAILAKEFQGMFITIKHLNVTLAVVVAVTDKEAVALHC